MVLLAFRSSLDQSDGLSLNGEVRVFFFLLEIVADLTRVCLSKL